GRRARSDAEARRTVARRADAGTPPPPRSPGRSARSAPPGRTPTRPRTLAKLEVRPRPRTRPEPGSPPRRFGSAAGPTPRAPEERLGLRAPSGDDSAAGAHARTSWSACRATVAAARRPR